MDMAKQWLHVIDEAVKRIENNEVELGIQALQKIEEHGKTLPEVVLYLADVWYQLGHLERAKALLGETLEANRFADGGMRRDAELLLAEVVLDDGDYERAQSILYKLKEEGVTDTRLFLLLADLYALQDLDEVAVKYLEMAWEQERDNQEIMAALGEMYTRIGRYEEAVRVLGQVDGANLGSLALKARMFAQSGQFEEAYRLYQQVLERDRSPEILFGCGLMAYNLGKLEEARGYIEMLLALEEEYVTAYPLLADIWLALGKTEQAIDALRSYVDLSGFDLDQIRRLTALLNQAGRYEEAREYQRLLDQWDADDEDAR